MSLGLFSLVGLIGVTMIRPVARVRYHARFFRHRERLRLRFERALQRRGAADRRGGHGGSAWVASAVAALGATMRNKKRAEVPEYFGSPPRHSNFLTVSEGMLLKLFVSGLIVVALCQAPAIAQTQPDQTVRLSNGATATSYHNCGDMDLCARVANNDGTVLSIYSEGAALCQPYLLHFVLQNASGVTQYEFSRMVNHSNTKDKGCGHTLPTQMVLDHGAVHLTVIETLDRTLSLVFSATH